MKTTKEEGKKPAKQIDLRDSFLKLSNNDQQAVTNFFNVHNVAHWIYYNCSADAQKYISYCIRLNSNANEREGNPEKHGGIEEY